MCPGGRYALCPGYSKGYSVSWGGDMPSIRGTLGVKVCVLGGDMPFVRGTLGVKVCVLGGDMPSVRVL